MKVVILAGGFGTRISEESQYKPKPMLEIGGKPILWHIMKEYSHYGFNEFVVCAGYRQHMIKQWFADYFLRCSDITFDYSEGKNEMTIHHTNIEPWKVTVVNTGLDTMTGGRIKRIQPFVENERFMMDVAVFNQHSAAADHPDTLVAELAIGKTHILNTQMRIKAGK